MINGIKYKTETKIPSLGFLFRVIDFSPDLIVIIEFTPVALLGFAFSYIFRRKLLLLIESDPRLRGSHSGKVMTFVKRFVTRRANVVMTNNILGMKYLETQLQIDPKKIIVAPYLTSDPNASPVTLTGSARPFKRSGKVNLLFLNSITTRKGIFELLRAIATLPFDSRENLFLHIGGDGESLFEAKALADQLSLGQLVHFYGQVRYEYINAFYQVADVVVCPTLADYRSLCGFEAINAGKPLLLSCMDGASHEILLDDRNGWLFDPNNLTSFSSRLEWISKNAFQLADFGEASKSLAEEFSLKQVGLNLKNATAVALGFGQE